MASPQRPSRSTTPGSTSVARAPSPNPPAVASAPAAPPQRVRSPPPHQPTTAADAVRAVIIAINGGASSSSSSSSSSAAAFGSSGNGGDDSGIGKGKGKGNGKSKSSSSSASAAAAAAGKSSPTGSDGSDERQPLVPSARDLQGDGDGGDEWLDDPIADDKFEWYWYWSLVSVVQWCVTRVFTLCLLLLGDGHHLLNRTASGFFGLELVLTIYFYHARRYFPGSVYTDVHFLWHHRVLRPAYVHNRFSPAFRFVFGLFGYFLVTGVLLNVDQWGDSPNLFLRIASYVVLVISLKQLVLYAPVIAFWYISLVISMYYFLCCWCLCVSTDYVPIFQDVTEEHWSFPIYKFIYENV